LLIGGLNSIPGLALRIKQEMDLNKYGSTFKYLNSVFNHSLLAWIGGSLIGCLNVECSFDMNQDDFNINLVPDWTKKNLSV
jgi:hypothetical protein